MRRPQKGQKNIFNVSENTSDRKLIFLYFGIHENVLVITQSVLIPQLLGDFASGLSADSAPAHPLGAQTPASPPQHKLLDPPLPSGAGRLAANLPHAAAVVD